MLRSLAIFEGLQLIKCRYETSTEPTMTLAGVDGVLKLNVQKSNEGEKSKNDMPMLKKVLVQLLVEVKTGRKLRTQMPNHHANVSGRRTTREREEGRLGRNLKTLTTMLNVCELYLFFLLDYAVRLYTGCYNTLDTTTSYNDAGK